MPQPLIAPYQAAQFEDGGFQRAGHIDGDRVWGGVHAGDALQLPLLPEVQVRADRAGIARLQVLADGGHRVDGGDEGLGGVDLMHEQVVAAWWALPQLATRLSRPNV